MQIDSLVIFYSFYSTTAGTDPSCLGAKVGQTTWRQALMPFFCSHSWKFKYTFSKDK